MKKAAKKAEPMYLQDLFLMKLEALYDTEKELVAALPKMAEKATDDDLAEAFAEHLEETKGHAGRLEEIFAILDKKPAKLKVEAIRGIAEDAEWVSKKVMDPAARDAALIGAAEHAEHYEISGYGTAIRWGRALGLNDAVELLEENLEEERVALAKLGSLAEGGIDEKTAIDDTEEGEAEDVMETI